MIHETGLSCSAFRGDRLTYANAENLIAFFFQQGVDNPQAVAQAQHRCGELLPVSL